MWQNQITVDLDLTYFSKKEKTFCNSLNLWLGNQIKILGNQIIIVSLKRVKQCFRMQNGIREVDCQLPNSIRIGSA